ncbi:MAG: NB-ARC domain-containing protein [Nostocales cyanobacterium 94392]|nr:NB-ARC domain-containing protein [Nostocales cyanobacterium 94392]
MIRSVVINLGYGNLTEGFPVVTAGLWELNNPRRQQFVGSLPAAPNLVELYRNWRLIYQSLCDRLPPTPKVYRIASSSLRNFTDDDEIEIDEGDITNVSSVDFHDLCQRLQLDINNWLESPGITSISRQLRALLNPVDEIRIIIETQDTIIQKLPWHCCSFFEDYPRSEVSFARTEYKRTPELQLSPTTRNQVRILAILGNSQGIDLEQEQRFLQSLPDAEVEFIVKPSRQEFNDQLWDSQGWDMLFFAGHSQTEEETGIIYINENPTNNSLTVEQLSEALKTAIAKGLKLAIFNSCDGLGLADGLEKLNIPTTIVMREPVPNRVAEQFFNYFLQGFAFAQKSLYISVQEARRKLQGLEDDFPGASWLPIIFINPAEEPPTWVSLKEKFVSAEDYRLKNRRDTEGTEERNKRKRRDWGEAIDVSTFYGRNEEVNRLEKWILTDNCRLVTVVGMGGIGKTALSVKLAELVEDKFDYLIWRSLRNATPVNELLSDLIGFLSSEHQIVLANSLDKQIGQLIDCLRNSRCLIVLDNLESVLDCEQKSGSYRGGYEGYGQLLRCVADTRHQSCCIVTSREPPKGFSARQGDNLPARMLTLKGLSYQECQLILAQKGLSTSATQVNKLVECYAGNPLALKIAATTIEELFDGDIADFLEVDTIICGEILDLLDQQFHRLSILEKQIMYWLAINREWVSLKDLQSDIIDAVKTRDLLAALEALQSRCLIETQSGKFTQQPVVMEYVIIEELIEQVAQAIYHNEIQILNKFALIKAQTQDYLRNAQIQFILKPLIDKLFSFWVTKEIIQSHLNQLLLQLQSSPKPGYAAGNIINLLRQLDIELNNYDFSNLNIWQANFQGINLQQTNFANCNLQKSVFTNSLGSILAAKFNPTGELFATAIENQIYLWDVDNIRKLHQLEGHTGWVRAIAFTPDGKILASGSHDSTIKLWNVETGQCLQTITGHTSNIQSLAFNRDGTILASGSNDKTVRLYDIPTGQCLILQGHTNNISFVNFHPFDEKLITASTDNTVRLWNIQTGECLQIFNIAINWLLAIAISHDGKTLVTGSDGNAVKFWDIETGECIKTLPDYSSCVWSIAFSHDDKFIITGSEDNTIKIWNVETGECLQTLREHQQRVWLVDLHPDNQRLLSISEDQTIKLWDVSSRRCLKTLKGYSNWILSLAFSSDGQTLASSSQDGKVRLWDMQTGQCNSILTGHDKIVSSVAFAPPHLPDCHLASGSDDNTIKLWNPDGECSKTLQGHDDWVYSVAFNPQVNILASGSRDRNIKIWDCRTGECLHTLVGHEGRVKSVSFSSNGTLLATASDDKTIKIWNVNNQTCLRTLTGHQDKLDCVVFGPNGKIIASTGCDKSIKTWDSNTGELLHTLPAHSRRIRMVVFSSDNRILASCSDDGTVKLWDAHTGNHIRTLSGHDKAVWAVAISPDNNILASGSEDQTIKLWFLKTGECIQTLRCIRPYEGMNIHNIIGLTTPEKTVLKSLGAVEGILT